MSAPSVSGRWSAGDANVLSTTTSGRRPPSASRRATVADGLRDVDDLEQRVRRRLEPDEPGALGERLPEDVRPGGQVDVARVDPLAALDALEIAIGPAVDVVADDDLLARSGELGDGRGRRRPRGEGDPVRTALERRDRPLEALARRVLRAGVLVPAARLADAVLGVGRGLVDRRRDGPGQLIGFGAGVDGTRREGELVIAHGRRVAGAWLDGRRAGGQPSSSKTSSSPSMSSIWTPTWREAEAPDDRQRGHVARRDRRPEAIDAVGERPVEQGMDDLGRDSLAPVPGLDPIADLDPAVGAGRGVEPARADDPARAVRLGQHDRPAEPGLRLGIDRQVRDPELQEVVERVGQVDRHDRADLVLGRLQVARDEAAA